MACDCITKLDEKLAEHNSRISTGFTFGSEGRPGYAFPALETEKIDKRNRKKISVIPTYCPFCGTAYRNEESARSDRSEP